MPTITTLKVTEKLTSASLFSGVLLASLLLAGCGGSSGSGSSSQSSAQSSLSSAVSSVISSSSVVSESSSSEAFSSSSSSLIVSSISSSSAQSESQPSSQSSSQQSVPGSSASSSVPGVISSSSSISSAQSSLESSTSSVVSSISSSSVSSSSSAVAAILSEKRGLAYGHHTPEDLAKMRGKISWWYNWSETPEASAGSNIAQHNVDFIPMTWNGAFNENRLRAYLDDHPEVKYLLGFNEPNFAEQANMTPQQVADAWPRLEAIAADYNLKLVGPAVNYSPGNVPIPGTDDHWDPWKYLDAFFAACQGCKVDYVAVHSYMKWPGAFEWFIGEFERYGLPIWVTEWAAWDEGGPANVGEQMDFLAQTVRWLEANPMVHRYSWFIGRSEGGATAHPFLDILGANGEFTPMGGLYAEIPSLEYRHAVPGVVPAQGAHRQSEFRHQTTTDTDGYVNLVSNNASAWAEYHVRVAQAGTYDLSVRVASNNANSALDVLLDGAALARVDSVNTGGVNAWQTLTVPVTLSAGEHRLRLAPTTAGVRLNWFELTPQ